MNHKCEIESSDEDAPKDGKYKTEEKCYGIAVNSCWEEDGKLWVGNGEYANTVNFCPFCGYKINANT